MNRLKPMAVLTPEPLSAEDDQKLKEGQAAIGVAR